MIGSGVVDRRLDSSSNHNYDDAPTRGPSSSCQESWRSHCSMRKSLYLIGNRDASCCSIRQSCYGLCSNLILTSPGISSNGNFPTGGGLSQAKSTVRAYSSILHTLTSGAGSHLTDLDGSNVSSSSKLHHGHHHACRHAFSKVSARTLS